MNEESVITKVWKNTRQILDTETSLSSDRKLCEKVFDRSFIFVIHPIDSILYWSIEKVLIKGILEND